MYSLGIQVRQKQVGLSKPRPLKLVLGSVEERDRVLKRTYRLRGTDIWVARDLSPEDRVRQREAVAELKERTSAGEKNLHIVNFRVRSRQSVKWRPVVLLPGKSSPNLADLD